MSCFRLPGLPPPRPGDVSEDELIEGTPGFKVDSREVKAGVSGIGEFNPLEGGIGGMVIHEFGDAQRLDAKGVPSTRRYSRRR